MKSNQTWKRVEQIKAALNLKTDVEFYRLAGADKGLGGQWKGGQVQSIGAEYAFRLQDKTGFQARWIMLGEGPAKIDHRFQTIMTALPLLHDAVIDGWFDQAKKAIESNAATRKHAS